MTTIPLFLIFSLISTTVFAMPCIGDRAKYRVLVESPNLTMVGERTTVLTARPTADTFEMTETFAWEGQTPSKQARVMPVSQLASDASLAAIMANCRNIVNVTVQAGSFTVCKLESESPSRPGTVSTLFAAEKVPFGYVSAEVVNTVDKTHTTLELIEFGQESECK